MGAFSRCCKPANAPSCDKLLITTPGAGIRWGPAARTAAASRPTFLPWEQEPPPPLRGTNIGKAKQCCPRLTEQGWGRLWGLLTPKPSLSLLLGLDQDVQLCLWQNIHLFKMRIFRAASLWEVAPFRGRKAKSPWWLWISPARAVGCQIHHEVWRGQGWLRGLRLPSEFSLFFRRAKCWRHLCP